MDVDPRTNVVVFQLNNSADELAVGRAPAVAEDGVRRAWGGVLRNHGAAPESVVALHSEWEPTPTDLAFIEATFPDAAVTFNFSRPKPDGWEEAFAAAEAAMVEAAAPATAEGGDRSRMDVGQPRTTGGGELSARRPADAGRRESADSGEALTDSGKTLRDGGGTLPAAGQALTGGGQLADGGETLAAGGQALRDSGEALPDSGGALTGGGQALPAGSQALRDGGGEALARAGVDGDEGQDSGSGELLPVLWSASSPRAGMLEAVPHWPVAAGRLHLALAVVAPTPRGTIGMYHVTHHQLGDQSFNELMAEACENLAAGLRVNAHETDEGQLLSLSGTLVAAAVCLPDFYRRLSGITNADGLVVGLPCPDEVYVAAADSPMAAVIHRAVSESEYPTTELIPSVLSIVGDDIEVLFERG